MNVKQYLPGSTPWHERIETGLRERLGDADALLLIPYDDGTFWLKQGYYDKELVGGIGGYETPDEDKFVVDGTGNAKRELFGVPVALAIDPSEHAGVVEPMKALVAQKDNMGEWLRVDRADAIADIGSALEPVTEEEYQQSQALQQEMAKMAEANQEPDAHEALLRLAERGEIRKLYDLTPKARVTKVEDTEGEWVEANVTDVEFDFDTETAADGGVAIDKYEEHPVYEIEEATGYIVDQSKAAELLPKKWTSEKLQVMQDKARMEEHEEGKLMKYFGYGLAAGFALSLVALGVFWFLGQIGGGLF